MAEPPTIDDAWVRALAGSGLSGAAAIVAPSMLDECLPSVQRHRLIGVLAGVIADGSVAVESTERDAVAAAHEQAMREVLLLEEELLAALDVLADAGVDSRVLKGSALAHMVHPDPAQRAFGDNDLLVAGADIDRAVAVLVSAGATRITPALSPSFDRRFAKSVTMRWHGTELDLHRTLAPGPYGLLLHTDDLWRDPVEFLLAGRAVRTLPSGLHLLHGAIHVALGDVEPRLGNVRDVALLAARPAIDVDVVAETAQRWGCSAPVALGLQSTAVLGHGRSPVEEWADAQSIGDKDRGRLASYRQRDGRYRRQALASLRELGWRDRLAFSRALLGRRSRRAGQDR